MPFNGVVINVILNFLRKSVILPFLHKFVVLNAKFFLFASAVEKIEGKNNVKKMNAEWNSFVASKNKRWMENYKKKSSSTQKEP